MFTHITRKADLRLKNILATVLKGDSIDGLHSLLKQYKTNGLN